MARKTARRKRAEKKIALALAGLLVLTALVAAMLASQDFAQWLFRAVGITQGSGPPEEGRNAAVAVHVIDVGQGDAVLLQADGEYALIDAGTPESADALTSYLWQAGVKNLRYVFMTHPHADHIGGMQAVIEQFGVEKLVLPDFSIMKAPEGGTRVDSTAPTSYLFEDLLAAAIERQVTTEQAIQNVVYPLGDGSVTVVHTGVPGSDNYNLLSLGLLFEAGGLRFLNTGDGEKQNEAAMLESGQNLGADVFMAGHHGSNTSNTADFVRAANPRLVLVSCGRDNSYGHPHETALASYSEVSAQVLRTDEAGSILMWRDEGGALHHAVTGAA